MKKERRLSKADTVKQVAMAQDGQLPAEGAKQGFCQRIKAAYERRSSGAELE
jgi:hypothetical protein